MLDRYSASGPEQHIPAASCTDLGEGLPLMQQVQQLGDDLQDKQTGLFLAVHCCNSSLLSTVPALSSAGAGYNPSPPTWEQRRVSRFGSWNMRAFCSTAPFSMP